MYSKLAVCIIAILFMGQLLMIVPSDGVKPSEIIMDTVSDINTEITDTSEQYDFDNIVHFTANFGQLTNDKIRFYSPQGGIWFSDNGLWLIFSEESKHVVLKLSFIDCNSVTPEGRDPLKFPSNFFYGSDADKWVTDVPSFKTIYYSDIYDGIDLRYYVEDSGLKYDFIIHPHADPGQIRINYDGAETLSTDTYNNLIIHTPVGNYRDEGLLIYQNNDCSKNRIDGSFVIFDDCEYGFEISGDYDKNEILIIDPYIEYSTFIGGFMRDRANGIAVDENNIAYIAGYTASTDFPRGTGVYDELFNGDVDVFVLALDSTGSNLIYSTFIGGGNDDRGLDIAVDSDSNAYVTGYTNSYTFPRTLGDSHSGYYDAFVFKLGSSGKDLNYSAFLGGTEYDYARGIALDSSGVAYLTGYTLSSDFPITSGAADKIHNGEKDIFVLKFNPDLYGSSPVFSTFIGGGYDDLGNSIAVDDEGNAYITGYTLSSDFPTTVDVYDDSHNHGKDAFVLKLRKDGGEVMFSTFIGGSDEDIAYDIALDKYSNSYITGETKSNIFPTSASTYDDSYNGGTDAFILRLDAVGSDIDYSTFWGGDGLDIGYSIAIDNDMNIYLTGTTESSDIFTSSNATDHSYNGNSDTFLLKIKPGGASFQYSTYIGGAEYDEGKALTIDSKRNIYIVGYTASQSLPVSDTAHDESYNGNDDAYAMKLSFKDFIEITSVSLFQDNNKVKTAYAKTPSYLFSAKIIDTYSIEDLEMVQLMLDPHGEQVKLIWETESDIFIKEGDPDNHITLEPTSNAYNNIYSKWTIEFHVIFNWTYPDEDMHIVKTQIRSKNAGNITVELKNVYQVENDLEFMGQLYVKGENDRNLSSGDYARGGEKLTWSGLTVVYQGSMDTYPDSYNLSVIIFDEKNEIWFDQPETSTPFSITTITPSETNIDGYNYEINITGAPYPSESYGRKFQIKIDGDFVKYKYPKPSIVQISLYVEVGITLFDAHSGVDASSIEYTYSRDSGLTWTDWIPLLKHPPNAPSINVSVMLVLEDGEVNRIKWRAKDVVGNGPLSSSAYVIRVNLSYIPEFRLGIELESEDIKLEPGGNTTVSVKVKNNGEYEDEVIVYLIYDSIPWLICDVFGDNKKIIQVQEEVEFEINIRTTESANGSIPIDVLVTSLTSYQFDMNETESSTLLIEIVEDKINDTDSESESQDAEGLLDFLYRYVVFIAIIIIILIIIIVRAVIRIREVKKEETLYVPRVMGVVKKREPKLDEPIPFVPDGGPVPTKGKEKIKIKEKGKVIELKETAPGVWAEREGARGRKKQ